MSSYFRKPIVWAFTNRHAAGLKFVGFFCFFVFFCFCFFFLFFCFFCVFFFYLRVLCKNLKRYVHLFMMIPVIDLHSLQHSKIVSKISMIRVK